MKIRIENSIRTPRTALRNDMTTFVDLVIGRQQGQQSSLSSFNPLIQSNVYAPLSIDWMTLTYLYKTHGVLQTAIEVPVLDALRGGILIESKDMTPEDIALLQEKLEDDGIIQQIVEAGIWGRLYGGAALIVSIPTQDPAKPLVMNKLEGLKFHVCNRWELGGNYQARDVKDVLTTPMEKYNAANSDMFLFYNNQVHHSRVLQFFGKQAPHIVRWQLQGWGMSEVERMIGDFNLYLRTREVLYELLEEAKVDVISVENLQSALATDAGTQLMANRVQKANELKRFNRALVIDKNDTYDQKQLTFSGIADVMKENRIGIAAALRMPLTKLFGLSATGFNSGEDDIENYNSMVESEVRQRLKPLIRRIITLKCIELFGGEVPFRLKFEPLRELDAVQEETVKTSKQNRFLGLYDRMLANSQETAQMMDKEKLLPMEIEATKGLLEDHPAPAGMEGEEGEGDDKGKGKQDGKGKD